MELSLTWFTQVGLYQEGKKNLKIKIQCKGFSPPQFQCIGPFVYAIGGSKARNPFIFFLIKKGLQVFDLPILINKNPNAPELWKKKSQ